LCGYCNYKCSALLKAAAEKCHVNIVCELLKIGNSVEVSKKHGCATFIIAAENGQSEVLRLLLNNVAN
jgi:ankyrin repeat protein